MNKKLLALAVAGACVAPEAMAQTANPVTLYGRVYATFESVEAKGGTAAPVSRRNRVSDQSSLLGVRGTEDLGGGLKAFFQLETAFKPDQNDTSFAGRNSGVGLQGGWGSVLLGRWDTPFKTTTIAVDPFGDLTIGGITSAMSGSGIGNVQAAFDRRDQNVVQYWSPSWAGVAFRGSYSANEAKAAGIDPRAYSFSVTYTGGPIYVGAAYDELKDNRPAFAFTAPVVLAANAVIAKQKASAFFGTLTFGPVKLGALYEEIKREAPSIVNTTAGTITGFGSKQKAWMANIVYTLGNNQFIYQHQNAKDGGPTFVTSATVVARGQPDCKVDTIGYQYNFSRRTFLLAQYDRVDNNDQATCNFGANTLAIAAGQDPRGVSLGIRHIF
jgi:predicted porin